jgi:hypothetical protein
MTHDFTAEAQAKYEAERSAYETELGRIRAAQSDSPDRDPDHDIAGNLKKQPRRSPNAIADAERAAAYRVALNSGTAALAAFYMIYGGAPPGFFDKPNEHNRGGRGGR